MISQSPGPQWRKSSYSNGTGGECLEVAELPSHIGLRDSKDVSGPSLAVPKAVWAAFVSAVQSIEVS
ncbi:DUF397 domain-containing protein [Streptomyces sp. NBC_00344]|uniref:DUF397 domain-containing protein n=1 Tax=Streptomyces sp. NBC_00344 TaxID=2975720 RepID=UPI002E1F7990